MSPSIRIRRPRTPLSLQAIRAVVLPIAHAYGARNVRIFGSYARGQQRSASDVDLLVDLPEGMSLLDLSGLKLDLEQALKRKVDVVPARAIKPALRNRILAEARTL